MYLGNINASSYKQSFKPYALLFTICIREADWYADSYSIPDLKRLLKFIVNLPKQKHKTLISCIDFFVEKINRHSKH